MPDGDVFDRNVKPGWQTASRRVLAGGEGAGALPAVLRALAGELQEEGCPGIKQITDLLVQFVRYPSSDPLFRGEFRRLDRIYREYLCRATALAVASSKGILVGCEKAELAALDDVTLRGHFGSLILADRAMALMCPAPAFVHAVVANERVTRPQLFDRRYEMRNLIAAAPETRRMVMQVLYAPDGSTVERQRTSNKKLSQATILEIALTS